MSRFLKSFHKFILNAYFSVDVRALALLRMGLGICAGLDILRRFPYISLLYSNDGMWSNHYALFDSANPPFSLLYAFSTPVEVGIFFIVGLIASFCLFLGYYTWASTAVTLIWHVSIVNRNLLTVYAADTVLIIILLYSLFLPLGATWSVDSKDIKDSHRRFTSGIVFLCYLQLGFLYFLAGAQKTGFTWQSGNALYYVLHQERIITSVGVIIREFVPIKILRIMCISSRYLEISSLFLILSPVRTVICRRLAFFGLVSFHLVLALLVNLGIFSLVMITFLFILLPTRELNSVEDFFLKRFFSADSTKDRGLGWNGFVLMRELALIPIFSVFFVDLLAGNQYFSSLRIIRPHWIQYFVDYTSFRQSWSMFAPDAPTTDHHIVIDCEFINGQHIDILTGKAPTFALTAHNDRVWSQLSDALTRIPGKIDNLSLELYRWISQRRGGMILPDELLQLPIVHVSFYEITNETPPPSQQVIQEPVVRKFKEFSFTR